jgi:hypothetical protein
MKKFTAIFTTILFCALMILSVSAADYKLHENGEAYFETAVGYVFKIDDVNGQVTGEDSTIVTDNSALAKSGSKWAIWFMAEKVGDDVYVAMTDGAAMGGALPTVSLESNQIVIIVHSASSKPAEESQYPNWEAKVAALAVKTGDYLMLSGIDLDAKTSVGGTVTVASKEDVESGLVQLPEISKPEASSPVVEESTEESEEISVPVLGETPENEDYSDPEIKSSTMKIKAGFWDHYKWWVIGGSVGFICGAALVIVSKIKGKKNNAEPKEEVKEESKE